MLSAPISESCLPYPFNPCNQWFVDSQPKSGSALIYRLFCANSGIDKEPGKEYLFYDIKWSNTFVGMNEMIPERYLLYLDILGFAEMAKMPQRILDLYQIMNGLHVHQHDQFKCIVFSDTLLVYNIPAPRNAHDRQYCVMFLAEFAQDLLYRLIGRDCYFRAILTKGGFLHHSFKNLEAFFGQALIDSCRAEKELIGCGLFIDTRLLKENQIFPTWRHCDRYHYVFLTQDIQRASEYGQSGFPFPGALLDSTTMTFPTYSQLLFLADIYRKAAEHPEPRVRAKFQATWSFYQNQYPSLCDTLRQSDFDFNAVADADWKRAKKFFERELCSGYYRFNANNTSDRIANPRRVRKRSR